MFHRGQSPAYNRSRSQKLGLAKEGPIPAAIQSVYCCTGRREWDEPLSLKNAEPLDPGLPDPRSRYCNKASPACKLNLRASSWPLLAQQRSTISGPWLRGCPSGEQKPQAKPLSRDLIAVSMQVNAGAGPSSNAVYFEALGLARRPRDTW